MILEPSDDPARGILSVAVGSDGSYGDLLYLPGRRLPARRRRTRRWSSRQHYMHMSGNEVFKIAVRGMETVARQALAEAGLATSRSSTSSFRTRPISGSSTPPPSACDVPPEKVMVNIDRLGNTSSASIPLALDEAVLTGRIAGAAISS